MRGQRIGSFVAAVFGLIYAWVNSAPLLAPGMWLVRIPAAIAFVAIVVAVTPRPAGRVPHGAGRPGRGGAVVYPRSFWIITAAEVVALFGGLSVLNNVLHRPEASVAWVSVVVGMHFLPLGRLFRQRFFWLLGWAVAACGVVGLVLAVAGAPTWGIAAVSGVVPGALLLAAGGWGSRRRPTAPFAPASITTA